MRLLMIFVLSFGFALAAPQLSAGGSPPAEEEKTDPAVESYNKGTRLLFNGRYKAAIPHLRKAIKLNDDFAEAHNNLAFCLRKQGEESYEEALTHYNKAISIDSDLPQPYMYRGVLHVQMDNDDLARADLATLKQLDEELAEELEWVIDNGREKEPDQHFGVTQTIDS